MITSVTWMRYIKKRKSRSALTKRCERNGLFCVFCVFCVEGLKCIFRPGSVSLVCLSVMTDHYSKSHNISLRLVFLEMGWTSSQTCFSDTVQTRWHPQLAFKVWQYWFSIIETLLALFCHCRVQCRSDLNAYLALFTASSKTLAGT